MDDNSSVTVASLLGVLMRDLRTRSATYCRVEVTQNWGIDLPFEEGVRLHFVARGICWLRSEEQVPEILEAGDLCLLPHGTGHTIASSPSGAARSLWEQNPQQVADGEFRLTQGGPGMKTLVECCTMTFADVMVGRLTAIMPKLLILRHDQVGRALADLLKMMATEIEADRPGAGGIVARLADAAIGVVLRDWAESSQPQQAWLRDDAEPGLLRVLVAVLQDPARPWALTELAGIAAMSRTRFIEGFTALTGTPPGRYVAKGRMDVATSLLIEGRLSLGEIATRLGYSGASAFSRAYRTFAGCSPGAVRRSPSL